MQMLDMCHHSSNFLINLINDLLDHAKQEKLTFQFFEQFTNLANIIEDSLETLKFMSSQKNITTELLVSPNQVKLFENLYCDEKRLLQILLNFVSNALKFTNDGGEVQLVLKCENLVKATFKNGQIHFADTSLKNQSMIRAYI